MQSAYMLVTLFHYECVQFYIIGQLIVPKTKDF